MNRLMENIVALINGNIKCLIIKVFHLRTFTYHCKLRIEHGVSVSVGRGAEMIFGKNLLISKFSEILASHRGMVKFGNNVGIGKRNVIKAHELIIIGDNTIFGPDVKIYDHDHRFSENGVKRKEYVTSPVFIGENCWIGANTIILRGTKLGNNCIVGAGSILKGEYADNSVIIQKRETIIKNG